MIIRVRNITKYAVVAAITLASIAFTALWGLGPFFRIGVILPIPFANQTIDAHAGAGMMHVTFNHDRPPTAWWYIYDAGVYPPALRAQHLRTYRSFELPKSAGQKTSFGMMTWATKLWTGNQPAPRHTRFWFPVVVPATVLTTIAFAVFARWWLKRTRRTNGQITIA